jgi:hypothetical protein
LTWTYSGDPAAFPRDAVRFLLRDTDSSDQQLSDEEIAWLLSQNGGNVYKAAVGGARSVSARYSNQAVTKTVGALSLSYQARSEHYETLAKTLQSQYLTVGATFAPYGGGISVFDKEINEDDTDWDKPAFSRRLHRNDDVDGRRDQRGN